MSISQTSGVRTRPVTKGIDILKVLSIAFLTAARSPTSFLLSELRLE